MHAKRGFCTRICFRACIFQDVGHCHGGYRFGARQILRTPPHPTYGNSVRAYGAERTLCDMLRSTLSPDLQLLWLAFWSCFSSEGRSLPMLQSFAGELSVAAKVRRFTEMLL